MRRGAAAVLAACLVVPAYAGTSDALVPAAPAAGRTSASGDALDQLASCVASGRPLLTLLLFDESSSVQKTDPSARRAQAAEVALRELAALARPAGNGPQVDVEVALSGFSDQYVVRTPWTRLTRNTGTVLRTAREFAGRNQGSATDYVQALTGARQDFARRSAALTANGGQPPCQILLWFTDGAYYPVHHDAADIAQGKSRLCVGGGILDQLRDADVKVVSVALSTGLAAGDQAFLKQLTFGADGGVTCGRLSGPDRGSYLPASAPLALIQSFFEAISRLLGNSSANALCRRENCGFSLDPGLSSFRVLIQTGQPGARITFAAPDKSRHTIQPGPGGEANLAGAALHWDWVGRDVVLVRGRLDPAALTWVGAWVVGFSDTSGHPIPDSAGRIYLYGDLRIEPPEDLSVVRGRPWHFRTAVTTQARTPPTSSELAVARQVTATFADGDDERAATVTPADDGSYDVRFQPPPGWRSSTVRIRITLRVVTDSGIKLDSPDLVREVRVQAPADSLEVVPPQLLLPSVQGTHPATGELTVRARSAGGCVWVDRSAQASPFRSPGGAVAVEVPGGADSVSGCLRVPPGGERKLHLRFTPAGTGDGRAKGSVLVHTRSGPDGPDVPVLVPVAFDMQVPVDRGTWLLFALLVLLGVAPLLCLLVLSHVVFASFHDHLKLRVASIPVQVSAGTGDSVLLTRAGSPELIDMKDFDRPDIARRRRIRVGAVQMRAVASWWNPFASPVGRLRAGAAASATGRPDSTARDLRRLPLDLHGLIVVTVGRAEVAEWRNGQDTTATVYVFRSLDRRFGSGVRDDVAEAAGRVTARLFSDLGTVVPRADSTRASG